MTLDDECRQCLYNSQLKKVERDCGGGQQFEMFKTEVQALCKSAQKGSCAPILMRQIDDLHIKIFGRPIDYSKEKALFNGKLLSLEEEIYKKVAAAPDPVEEALKFAMASNYIDFARLSDLDEGAIEYVFASAARAKVPENTLKTFKNCLKNAENLLFLHDNCGEIVLDKVLIRVIKERFKGIFITSVVRGQAVINDVTEEDAREVGLEKYARVINNGTAVPGTPLNQVTEELKNLLGTSDVIISKGLGNLETLYGEGYGIFFVFACKCEHIAKRFNLPLWDTAFVT